MMDQVSISPTGFPVADQIDALAKGDKAPKCGVCGSGYRSGTAPETYATAFLRINMVGGSNLATLVNTGPYTMFGQQGLSSDAGASAVWGALTGRPTQQLTNQYGSTLDVGMNFYVAYGIRTSILLPRIYPGTSTDDVYETQQLAADDLATLREWLNETASIQFKDYEQDCEYPIGTFDFLTVGPQGNAAAGDRTPQPVYFQDKQVARANTGGKDGNMTLKLYLPDAPPTLRFANTTFTATTALYVPIKVYLSLVRDVGDGRWAAMSKADGTGASCGR